MTKKQISIRLEPKESEFYDFFETPTGGVQYVAETFPLLCEYTLKAELRGMFSKNELILIIEAGNGHLMTAGLVGQEMVGNVADAIELDQLDKKWKVEKQPFLSRLRKLTRFQNCVLWLWAKFYWSAKNEEKDFNKYVENLL